MRSSLLATLALVAAVGCGPKDYQLPELGVTVTAPSGWSLAMTKYSIGAGSAEIRHGRRTVGFIDKAGDISLTSASMDKEKAFVAGPHTVDTLAAALADAHVEAKDSFDHGFGVRYRVDGKPRFYYLVTAGGKEYPCTCNDWIKDSEMAGAISVCKGIH